MITASWGRSNARGAPAPPEIRASNRQDDHRAAAEEPGHVPRGPDVEGLQHLLGRVAVDDAQAAPDDVAQAAGQRDRDDETPERDLEHPRSQDEDLERHRS